MIKIGLPEPQFEFFLPDNTRLRPDSPDFFDTQTTARAAIREFDEQKIAAIQEAELPKPPWFKTAEAKARQFLGSLAFTDLAPIVLVHPHPILEDYEDYHDVTLADYRPEFGLVLAYAAQLRRFRQRWGDKPVAVTLAHELTHAAGGKIDKYSVQAGKRSSPDYRYSHGFMRVSTKAVRGGFYEEGLAEFVGGWLLRNESGQLAPTVSITGHPSPVVPTHYGHHLTDFAISGPDGYAMELLAWGVERRGIMQAHEFIAIMLETRRPETRLKALREHAQAVDMLEPGLHPLLRDLEYSRENWQLGLQTVHQIVTRPGRGRLSRVV